MNDLTYELEAEVMHAQASITYNTPVGADYADGTITVTDYLQLIEAAATGTITIVDYTALTGATITVDGVDYVEGVDFTAETSNDVTATNLAAAIDADAQGASATTNVVTVTAASAGEAGNAIDLATDDATNAPVSGATLTGGQDHASFNVDGTTLVQGTDFTAETDNDTTATNIATAADLISGVGAAAVDNVVTITDDVRGTAGNANVLTADVTGGATVSGSGTFTGGVDGDTVVVNGTTCTCVVGTAGANEFSTITELEALCEAIANINSSEDGTTVSLNADAVGTGGNSYTLALGGSNAGDMAISGALFTGGAAALYTDVYKPGNDLSAFEVFIDIDTLSGGSPTADYTIEQRPTSQSDWVAAEDTSESALSIAQMTAAGQDRQNVPLPAPENRVKIVLGGTSPVISGRISFVPRRA